MFTLLLVKYKEHVNFIEKFNKTRGLVKCSEMGMITTVAQTIIHNHDDDDDDVLQPSFRGYQAM